MTRKRLVAMIIKGKPCEVVLVQEWCCDRKLKSEMSLTIITRALNARRSKLRIGQSEARGESECVHANEG